MNVDLSPEQEEIRTLARRFLQKECPLPVVSTAEQDPFGHNPGLWAGMAELGMQAMPLPEPYGGSGLGMTEVVTLAREFGRVLLPSPFISTVMLAGGCLASLGNERQQQHYLPRIATGGAVLGFALQEGSGGYGHGGVAASARAEGDAYVLSGEKRFVEFAGIAERILVVARLNSTRMEGDGLGLFLVDPRASGVSIRPVRTLARDRQCHLGLEGVRVTSEDVVGTPGKVWPDLERVIQRGVLAFAAQMLGASERAQELAMDYARQRVQFGKPIATFQAIQHSLAQMAIENTALETLVYFAAWNLDSGHPARAEVARTKLAAGNALKFATSRSAEIYGGMGFVDEVDIAYYLRRGKQWQLQMGEPRFWEEALVSAVYGRDAA